MVRNPRIFSETFRLLCGHVAGGSDHGNRSGFLLFPVVETNGQSFDPGSRDAGARIDLVFLEKHPVRFAAARSIRGPAVTNFLPTRYGLLRGVGRVG